MVYNDYYTKFIVCEFSIFSSSHRSCSPEFFSKLYEQRRTEGYFVDLGGQVYC